MKHLALALALASTGGSDKAYVKTLSAGLPFLSKRWNGVLSTSPGSKAKVPFHDDAHKSMIGLMIIKPSGKVKTETIAMEPSIYDDTVLKRCGISSSKAGPSRWRVTYSNDDALAVYPLVNSGVPTKFYPSCAHMQLRTLNGYASSGMEVPVYAVRGDWYEVAKEGAGGETKRDTVWMKQQGSLATFAPFKNERQRLVAQSQTHDSMQSVRILSVQSLKQMIWVKIEVLDHGPCEEEAEKVLAVGWVPLKGEDGSYNLETAESC